MCNECDRANYIIAELKNALNVLKNFDAFTKCVL